MSGSQTDHHGMEETLTDESGPAPSRPELGPSRGESIGRYVILEEVGVGGMGTVYAAFDPELDRKVAVKLLHADGSKGEVRGSDGRSRLLREAQAMAKLAHPNVVTVHDVGVHEGRVFLAMEYVEGETLGRYLKRETLAWSRVLEVFLAAGRGLVAAHEAGLVHRDFKPDNVLMGASGAVKVTDFGLARDGATSTRARGSAASTVELGVVDLGGELTEAAELSFTRTGAVFGTPAYMAPEQHSGLPTDARTDQFSFCVALYEGLYGERPFEDTSRAALALAVTEGRIRAAPAGASVPAWLRQVLLRGLVTRPADRFATMAELLEALRVDPRARRRRWFGAAAAAVVLGGGGFAIAGLDDRRDHVCADLEHHLEGVWDEARRAELDEALHRSGAGFADSTLARVRTGFDEYAAAWVAQRTDACEATQVRGEQSQALMDRRMSCLDERLHALGSLVDVLVAGDATAAQKAVAAVGVLPDLGRCADASALLAAESPPEPAAAAAVASVRDRLTRVSANEAAGQYETGLALAREVVADARAAGHAPTLSDALYGQGRLEYRTGALDEGEKLLREAFFSAVREGRDDIAARAAAELVDLEGQGRARTAPAREWAAHAQAHADASGQPLLRASALHALAGVAHKESAFDEARGLAEEALEIRSRELGGKHEALLSSLNLLGLIATDTGDDVLARARFEEGLELGREVLGEDHPDLGRFINNLAKISWRKGKIDEAKAAFEEALALQERAFGPEHPNVAQMHNNLAAIAVAQGDLEEAARRFSLALQIWEQTLGPEHPSVADGLNNLAVVASERERFAEAREYDERALAIRLRTMEPDHPAVAQNYTNLAEDLRHLGEPQQALELHRKALQSLEPKLGPEHDDVAVARMGIGEDLVELGRAGEAVPELERALHIRGALEIDEVDLAHTKWALARALWYAPREAGRDRARAVTLAEEAAGVYESRGETARAGKVRSWLADPGKSATP